MATPAIEIENVSKLYKLGYYGADTFRDEIVNFFRRLAGKPPVNALVDGQGTNKLDSVDNTDLVWALKDINLTINQGDIVGIIGKNGAGKSTLLKILSKITTPTTGQIKINGRMASLLEVGTGMNPELTGRENIFLNGAILGMTKREIKSKIDDIIDFSGIAKYADTPIKRYSSGMRVRLGFAISAFLEPEILVVDEVLAVGDAEFQKRAIGKMQDISKGQGRTVLFVSHNMTSIKNLCKTGVMMKNGMVDFTGDIDSTINRYISTNISHAFENLSTRKDRIGNQKAKIINLDIIRDGEKCDSILINDKVTFEMTIDSDENLSNIAVGLSIWNMSETIITHTNSNITEGKFFNLHKGINKIKCDFSELPLQHGEYYLNLVIYNKQEKIDHIERAVQFSVISNDPFNTGKEASKYPGCIVINNNWKFEF